MVHCKNGSLLGAECEDCERSGLWTTQMAEKATDRAGDTGSFGNLPNRDRALWLAVRSWMILQVGCNCRGLSGVPGCTCMSISCL